VGLLPDRPIKIKVDVSSEPTELYMRGQWSKVEEVLEVWRDTGCWWEGEEEKIFYRVALSKGGMVEIYRYVVGGKWFVYRIYD